MSVLGEYPEAINKKDLQIWHNAAFDNGGDSQTLNSIDLIKSPCWMPKKSGSVSNSTLDSSSSCKENQSPIGLLKSSVLVHPHQSKPLKNLPIKSGLLKTSVLENLEEKTEEEIEIENEISRLFAKLEVIRLKRAEKNASFLEKQGKSMAAKFLELDKKKESGVKKIQESSFSRTKVQKRGFSLGPNEIMSATNSKSKQFSTTPIQSIQNRRKSCFWKLEDIDEEKLGFSRGKNLSLRQAVTTVGSKKGMKKDDLILASVQPKKLFGEQSVPAKKPLKPGRVIASRYNQATVNSLMKKRSLTENIDQKSRVKKKWEIPIEIVVPRRMNLDDNEVENEDFVAVPEVLPRIRAVRCMDDPGRDSGPAKRVAELVGKKSYFHEESEEAVCQRLSFEEEH